MREVFQTQLQEVQVRLVEMAEDTVRIMEKATKAFTESNVQLADEAIAIADQTGNKALALDELVIRILAKQSPVARDLRILVSALRMSASLERMGDMAEHLAQLTRYRFPEKVIAKGLRTTFKEMGEIDIKIAEKLIKMLKSQELKQLESYLLKLTHVGYVQRDPQAAELIAVAFASQIDAPYLAVQRCLELERELEEAKARIAQLEQFVPTLATRPLMGSHSLSVAA